MNRKSSDMQIDFTHLGKSRQVSVTIKGLSAFYDKSHIFMWDNRNRETTSHYSSLEMFQRYLHILLREITRVRRTLFRPFLIPNIIQTNMRQSKILSQNTCFMLCPTKQFRCPISYFGMRHFPFTVEVVEGYRRYRQFLWAQNFWTCSLLFWGMWRLCVVVSKHELHVINTSYIYVYFCVWMYSLPESFPFRW